MLHLPLMLKPVSSLCNMRCGYCFYFDAADYRALPSYGRMDPAAACKIMDNVFAGTSPQTEISLSFQGGEPMLAGLDFYRELVAYIEQNKEKRSVTYSIQTNGLLVDEDWCRFFADYGFLVGLSIDGLPDIHDLYRRDNQDKATYQRVMKSKGLLWQKEIPANILCTLTDSLARHPQKVWRFMGEEQIDHIQFTPCLGPLSGESAPWTLTPRRFHSFYLGLFRQWERAVRKGRYISIKLFDDIVNLFVKKQVTACGLDGKCRAQHVLEADGGLYPCDFYVLDQYRVGSLLDSPYEQVRTHLQTSPFLEEIRELPPACNSCPYLDSCAGGCKRMAGVMYVDNNGFCGYRSLLDDIGASLCRTGEWIMNRPYGYFDSVEGGARL